MLKRKLTEEERAGKLNAMIKSAEMRFDTASNVCKTGELDLGVARFCLIELNCLRDVKKELGFED